MVLDYLKEEPAKDLTGYLRKARRLTLRTLRCDLLLAPDKLFSDINTQIPNPPLSERLRQAWISDETWAAIDTRVTAHQEGSQRTVRKLIRRIRACLITDRTRRS